MQFCRNFGSQKCRKWRFYYFAANKNRRPRWNVRETYAKCTVTRRGPRNLHFRGNCPIPRLPELASSCARPQAAALRDIGSGERVGRCSCSNVGISSSFARGGGGGGVAGGGSTLVERFDIEPYSDFSSKWSNFIGLVLFCIDAKFYKKIFVGKLLTRSSRFTCFCTAQTLIFQKCFVNFFRIFWQKFAKFRYFWILFTDFCSDFDEILSEFRR